MGHNKLKVKSEKRKELKVKSEKKPVTPRLNTLGHLTPME